MSPHFPKAPAPVARSVAASGPSHPTNPPQRTPSSGSSRPEGAPAPIPRGNSTDEIQPRQSHVVLQLDAGEGRVASNPPPAPSQQASSRNPVSNAVIAAIWTSPLQEIIRPGINGAKAVVGHLYRVGNEALERRSVLSAFNHKPYVDQVYQNFETLLDKAREADESVDSQEMHPTSLRQQLKTGLTYAIETSPEFRETFANLAGSLNQNERIDAAEKIATHGVVGPVLAQVLAKEIRATTRANKQVSNPSESLVENVSHRWENRDNLQSGFIYKPVSFKDEQDYLMVLQKARSMCGIQSQSQVISPLAKVLLDGSPTSSKTPDEVVDQFIQEVRPSETQSESSLGRY